MASVPGLPLVTTLPRGERHTVHWEHLHYYRRQTSLVQFVLEQVDGGFWIVFESYPVLVWGSEAHQRILSSVRVRTSGPANGGRNVGACER